MVQQVFIEVNYKERIKRLEQLYEQQLEYSEHLNRFCQFNLAEIRKFEGKQKWIRKHLGRITNFPIGKYKSIERRLEESVGDIDNLTRRLTQLQLE